MVSPQTDKEKKGEITNLKTVEINEQQHDGACYCEKSPTNNKQSKSIMNNKRHKQTTILPRELERATEREC